MLIAIAAGEPSGDILAAGLISEISVRMPSCRFFGIGGPKMEAAGCELLYSMDAITVMGVDEALRNLFPILKLRKNLARQIISRTPDAFIGVDAPDFNIGLALKLKGRGIKTIHYVSPTVWAWRSYRIHKIKRAVDHMLTLFPFEKAYYDKVGVAASFVGHPAAKSHDGVSVKAITNRARETLGVSAKVVVGLMPGSRRSEIDALLAPILESAKLLSTYKQDVQFVMPFAKQSLLEEYAAKVDAANLPVTKRVGQSHLVMQASNIMILASGTAALEALLHRAPMVVVYKVSKLSYFMFRLFASVKHFSMPNHLLSKQKVPELSQNNVTAENIVREVLQYLDNPQMVDELQSEFAAVTEQLAMDSDAEAAKVVLAQLGTAP